MSCVLKVAPWLACLLDLPTADKGCLCHYPDSIPFRSVTGWLAYPSVFHACGYCYIVFA